MEKLMKIYDPYILRVRISVGIIVMAPIILSLYLLVPSTRDISFTTIIIIISFGMCNLMISLSRYLGRNAAKKCFSGLLPAQQMLLPNDTTLDSITKRRYQDFLSSKIENLSFSKESNDVELSCSSAVNWLIAQTRDDNKYPLIKEESINYGFVKNLYGLKNIGIIVSLLLCVLETILLFAKIRYTVEIFDYSSLIAALVISTIYLLLWIFAINKALVVDGGKKYARALLSACDSILLEKDFSQNEK